MVVFVRGGRYCGRYCAAAAALLLSRERDPTSDWFARAGRICVRLNRRFLPKVADCDWIDCGERFPEQTLGKFCAQDGSVDGD